MELSLNQLLNNVFSYHRNSIALQIVDQRHTYEELDVLSKKYAYFLKQQNLDIESCVAIEAKKSITSYALLIACMRLGIPYCFFDPENPINRVQSIIDQCKACYTIVCNKQFLLLQNTNVIEIQNVHLPDAIPDIVFTPIPLHNVAYIMFTSGSTGVPKGVKISHNNLLQFIPWAQKQFSITSKDIFTGLNPLFFDNSVFDTYVSLFSGATLVPIEKEFSLNISNFVQYIKKTQCTVWFSVPSLYLFYQQMRAFDGNNFSSIQKFIFGGEGFPLSKLQMIYKKYPDAYFYNVSGPTECTCICSCYLVQEKDFSSKEKYPPIGHINSYFSYQLIGNNGKEVSNGQKGELYLYGPAVGQGYVHNPKKTKENFIFNDNHYVVGYKTGDILYKNKENHLLYIQGRKDHQIKHMGYRIELGEIEQALYKAGAEEASVLYDEEQQKIIAFVVCVNADQSQLIRTIHQYIPDYMVPSDTIFIDHLPKTANGKTDRIKLKEILCRN